MFFLSKSLYKCGTICHRCHYRPQMLEKTPIGNQECTMQINFQHWAIDTERRQTKLKTQHRKLKSWATWTGIGPWWSRRV